MTNPWPPDLAAEHLSKLHADWRTPPEHLIAKKGQFSYLGHAHVTDALLAADPLWSWDPMAYDERGLPRIITVDGFPVGLWIRLTVCGHSRPGYGSIERAGAKDPGNAIKELIGDALRNGAMRFGVGLGLWTGEI